jgi:hypothetical protein
VLLGPEIPAVRWAALMRKRELKMSSATKERIATAASSLLDQQYKRIEWRSPDNPTRSFTAHRMETTDGRTVWVATHYGVYADAEEIKAKFNEAVDGYDDGLVSVRFSLSDYRMGHTYAQLR